MKKIGLLTGSLSGAGAEKTILTLASAIAKQGHEVHLFLLKKDADYQISGNIRVWVVESIDNSHEIAFNKINQEISALDLYITSRAEHYNSVNSKQRYCSVHITPTAWLKKRPLILQWKTFLQRRKLSSKFSHKNIVALSQGIKNDLVNNLRIPESKVTVINNPFDIDHIRLLSNKAINNLSMSTPFICYVAALIPRKRHADLLRAFANIDDQSQKLILIGKGPLKNQLEALSRQLSIQDKVIFWPWDPNPYKLIKHATLSVLTSEAEGLPRALIESIIIGTPVISTDCPSGPNEVLIENNKKWLIPVGDIPCLTKAINDILQEQPNQNIDISRFDAEKVANKYLDLINE